MAIGMEIEVAVPIDRLTAADIGTLRTEISAAAGNKYSPAGLRAQGVIHNNGRVPYCVIRAPANGFRVDADHDDRVMTRLSWPPFEGGEDSIIEIVMDPPATDATQFNTAMNNIQAWINNLFLQTNNLTTRWVNALQIQPPHPSAGTQVSIGPLTFAAGGGAAGLGPRPRQLNHNLRGSCQVNLGIDVREYHSILKWFAKSRAARSHNETDPAAQAVYRQSKLHIREAVNIGRTLTRNYSATLTAAQRAAMGNLRGLRGWITHMALYIKRGTVLGGLGGTPKNLAPVLLKSPPSIADQYGITPAENAYFQANRNAIVDDVLNAVGRVADVGQPLNAVRIFPHAAIGGHATLDDLSDLTGNVVPLTGGPLINPTGVGPARFGNAQVAALPVVPLGMIGATPAGARGGVVAEFRNIPGFYDGVAAWRQLGLQFFNEAERRNQRSGIQP